jgi:hypothetical protein
MGSRGIIGDCVPATNRSGPRFAGVVVRAAEAFAVRLRPHLPLIHAAMAVGFLGLILAPVALPAGPQAEALGEAARWLIWTLWFPLVFLSVLLAGRTWCGVLCPMGAASEWLNRFGLKRPVPGWLRWEGTPIVSFLIITVLGQTVGVRDYPDAIAEVFGGTLLAALAIGLLYGSGKAKRAWCRHACPIGLLLGVFSRLGTVNIVPKRAPRDREGYTERGLCPTMIDLKRKTESRHCIMCMRCVQPERQGGLRLALRMPGGEAADIARHHPSASEVWFMLLGTGVALGGFLWLVLPEYQALRRAVGAWAIGHGWTWIGRPGPGWLMVVHPEAREVFVWLDFLLIVGWMAAVMIGLTALVGAANGLSAWLAGRLGASATFRERLVRLGYQFAPPAMISLLLGLGGDLFAPLPAGWAGPAKVTLLVGAIVWGGRIGWRIVGGLGLSGARAAMALAPGLAGSVVIAAAWWPAVVGG